MIDLETIIDSVDYLVDNLLNDVTHLKGADLNWQNKSADIYLGDDFIAWNSALVTGFESVFSPVCLLGGYVFYKLADVDGYISLPDRFPRKPVQLELF